MKTVTKEWLYKYTTKSGIPLVGINNSQAVILGYENYNDLKKGWSKKVIGMSLTNASTELFELLHNATGKKVQKRIIDDFKNKGMAIAPPSYFLPTKKYPLVDIDTGRKSIYYMTGLQVYSDGTLDVCYEKESNNEQSSTIEDFFSEFKVI